MKFSRSLLLFLTAVLTAHPLGASGNEPVTNDPRVDQAIADALAATFEDWIANVRFRSRYRLSSGLTDSVAAGLAGSFSASPAVVTGQYIKDGLLVRYSVEHGFPPVVISQTNDGRREVQYVSFDEIRTPAVQAVYLPPHERSVGSLFIAGAAEVGRSDLPGPYSQGQTTPLSMLGGKKPSPFSLFSMPGANRGGRAVVYEIDQDHLSVSITFSSQHCTEEKQIQFWTAVVPPVVDRASVKLVERESGRVYEIHAAATDFAECPGGMVARCVRTVTKTGDGTLFLREWLSDDLGAATPSEQDFRIAVAPSAHIRGIENPPPPGALRLLDLTQLQRSDLKKNVMPASAKLSRRIHPHVQVLKRPQVAWTVFLGAVVGIASILGWRRWNGRST